MAEPLTTAARSPALGSDPGARGVDTGHIGAAGAAAAANPDTPPAYDRRRADSAPENPATRVYRRGERVSAPIDRTLPGEGSNLRTQLQRLLSCH